MRRAALVVLIVLTGCGPRAATAPSAPTAPPEGPATIRPYAGPPLAILVDRWISSREAPRIYKVALAAANGIVVASVTPAQPSIVDYLPNPPAPPLVSASRSRLYYLDGDSDVKFLAPDGTTGRASRVPGGPRSLAAFSVSPDDRRIAVSVLDYSSSPLPALRLYVEDLARGTNHVELPVTALKSAWPVGWHGGKLVLAVGPDQAPNFSPNPYNALSGYRLVDPSNGTQLAAIEPACAHGPLVAAGTACWFGSSKGIGIGGWDGTSKLLPGSMVALQGRELTLAPDGLRVAANSSADIISLFDMGGPHVLPTNGRARGWVDATHLVSRMAPDITNVTDVQLGSALSVKMPCVSQCPAVFFEFLGTLPASLD